MENNSDRMGFALIALSVVAFVLLAVNGPLKASVDGLFNGFKDWQTQTVNGISETTKQVTHTAYAYSSDGTDRFTTTQLNLNLLDGSSSTLKTVTGHGWGYNYVEWKPNTSILIKGQTYTYNIWIQDCDVDTRGVVYLYDSQNKQYNNLGNIIKAGTSGFSTITFTIDIDVAMYNAGVGFLDNLPNYPNLRYKNIKLEQGSTATPWIPSASEVKPSDQPKYIGTYTDKCDSASQDPKHYTWKLNSEYHE